MIKSLGQQLDPRDFLRITLGNQHAFVIIQNSDLSRPLIVTWPVLISIIKSNIDAGTGTSFSVNDEGVVIQNDPTFLNFTGAGVTVTQSDTGVEINIPGGGSSFITSVSDTADILLAVTASDLTATLTTTGVTANTYGSATQVPQITVDSKGRITGVTLVTITGASAITSLNGLTASIQTFVNETNLHIVSTGTTHTLAWSGTLADARIASAAVWNAKQAALSGTGVVKSTSGTISYINGTSSQFIKGDGSLDSSTYLTDAPSDGTTYGRNNGAWTAVTSTGGGLLHGTTSGTDTYTTTITGATAYTDGDAYLIRFAIGNTTSATLNINSQGAVPLYRNNDGPLLGGDVIAGGEMICVYNSTLNVFQCIGISPNSLIAYVTNDDSVTITKGQPVYAFSGTGDRMTVKLAYNTSDATSAQTVGLVLSTSIAANQKGLIMMQGLLDGLSNVKPANGWADGSPVYLGTTAGSITPTKQYAPNHLVYLGFVTTASPGSAGRIYVRVQNGYELDELHNVQAQTPANKDTLYFDNTVTPNQWKTASIPTILGYTPLSQTLANTQLFVGNASNVATAVPMSGDATIANTGVLSLNTSFTAGSFGVTFDGGTALITSGKIAYVRVPYKGTITGWQLVADQSGSCSITVKQGLFSPFPPTTTIITAALSGTQTSSATGLSLPVAAGDWFSFTITGTSAVQLVNLSISITKII